MIEAGEVDHGTVYHVAPLVLSVMQFVSCISGLVTDLRALSVPLTFDPLNILWFVVSFSPILLVAIVSRIGVLISVMAVPIFAIFCARMYDLVLFLESQQLNPKGDFGVWMSFFFGLISVAGIAAWIFTRVFMFLVEHFRILIAYFLESKK